MTEEKKAFSFGIPFTADPKPETVEEVKTETSTHTVEDIDSMTPGQTITITGIMDDDIYHDLKRKHGQLEITYSRTDERDNHDEWAEGGTLVVTRR
tara:strand:- start:311 stop:598 length:288 start_codon:yes stop_codon:yes gene_type:complete